MNEIRATFLATSRISLDLLARPEIVRRWEDPSALAHWSVRGLSGHLMRATASVQTYLDGPEPDAEPISPAAYYAAAVDEDDLTGPLHTEVRQKGEESAAGGPAEVVGRLEETIGTLDERLRSESPERRVAVFRGLVLQLDDYLITRILELVVHIDDLAVSIDVPTPELPEAALDRSIDCLIGIARHEHGDLAVLRALARRERDAVSALRFF